MLLEFPRMDWNHHHPILDDDGKHFPAHNAHSLVNHVKWFALPKPMCVLGMRVFQINASLISTSPHAKLPYTHVHGCKTDYTWIPIVSDCFVKNMVTLDLPLATSICRHFFLERYSGCVWIHYRTAPSNSFTIQSNQFKRFNFSSSISFQLFTSVQKVLYLKLTAVI